MNTKTLTLAIMLLMVLGSLGVNAVNPQLKNDNNKEFGLLSASGSSGTFRAVLVGVSDYYPPGDSSQDLSYCHRDAIHMSDVLKKYNWSEDNIELLTNSDATKNNILDKLDQMAEEEVSGDISLFHFSGHGTRFGSKAAICAHDSGIAGGNIYADKLADHLDNFEGKVVVVLDSCYAGGMKNESGVTSPEIMTEDNLWNLTDMFRSEIGNNKENRVILMGCAENQYSYEVSGNIKHGLFSWYILKGLGYDSDDGETGPADDTGNKDDIITAEEVFFYARKKTVDHIGKNRQSPQIYDGDKNDGGVTVIYNRDDNPDDPDPAELYITIHRIKMVDDIDVGTEADLIYELSVFNGNEWISETCDYTHDDNDHSEDVTSTFEVYAELPEINIKVLDIDKYTDDIADISNKSNADGDPVWNPINGGPQDPDGRVFELRYNMSKQGNNGIIDEDSHRYETDNNRLFTRGDWDESTDPEIPLIGKQDDAKLWFSIDDNYDPEDFKPILLLDPTTINFNSIKKGETVQIDFKIKNNAPKDPINLPKNQLLEWKIDEKPSWVTSISPNYGSLEAQANKTVTITIDTSNMKRDDYSEPINIGWDDNRDEYTTQITVTITVSKVKSFMMNTYEVLPIKLLRFISFFFSSLFTFI